MAELEGKYEKVIQFIFLTLLIYFEVGGGERIPSRLRTDSEEPDKGLAPTDQIMTWAETKTLNGLSHPGAPGSHLLICISDLLFWK